MNIGVESVVPEPGECIYAEALKTAGAQEIEVECFPDGTIELQHVGDDSGDASASDLATGGLRSG